MFIRPGDSDHLTQKAFLNSESKSIGLVIWPINAAVRRFDLTFADTCFQKGQTIMTGSFCNSLRLIGRSDHGNIQWMMSEGVPNVTSN
jgi:hypothetical protein